MKKTKKRKHTTGSGSRRVTSRVIAAAIAVLTRRVAWGLIVRAELVELELLCGRCDCGFGLRGC